MNEDNYKQNDYKSDYEQLELNDRADWGQAKTNYRRLVHLWHPDKYAQKPRERQHAQQQFILLTKSYDNLKSFVRENDRLPFEPANSRRKTPESEPSEQISNPRRKFSKAADQQDNPEELSPHSLARDEAATDDAVIKPNHTAKILWTICGASLLFGTIVIFFLIDRSTNQKVIEKGRAAIRAAPASEFMPTAAEIRKSESRGAFIKPTQ